MNRNDGPIERWDDKEDVVASARNKAQFPFLDEFIAKNVDIHYEAMDFSQFWIGITCRETGRTWHLNVGALNPNAKGYAIVEENRA